MKARKVYDYKCLQGGQFAVSRIAKNPFYIAQIKNSTEIKNLRFIDIGACFGADIRRFILDGGSVENVEAVDVCSDFWEMGMKLFGDEEFNSNLYKKKSKVTVASLFDDFIKKLELSLGHSVLDYFDVVFMGSVLHLFTEDQIRITLKIVLSILKKNGWYICQHVGALEPTFVERQEGGSRIIIPPEKVDRNKHIFLHSPQSMKEEFQKCGFQEVDTNPKKFDADDNFRAFATCGKK